MIDERIQEFIKSKFIADWHETIHCINRDMVLQEEAVINSESIAHIIMNSQVIWLCLFGFALRCGALRQFVTCPFLSSYWNRMSCYFLTALYTMTSDYPIRLFQNRELYILGLCSEEQNFIVVPDNEKLKLVFSSHSLRHCAKVCH